MNNTAFFSFLEIKSLFKICSVLIINSVSMFIESSSILFIKCNQGYWTFDHDVLVTLENSQPAYVPFPRTRFIGPSRCNRHDRKPMQ